MEDEAAARIREAIGSEDYQLASRLWNLYAGQLHDEVLSGTLSEARMAGARELVAWGREVLICARSLALDNLNALHVARSYAVGQASWPVLDRPEACPT